VVETHPPNWNLSQGLIWELGDPKPSPRQQLLFLKCCNIKGDDFIVRIDYTFDTFGESWAWPQTAKVLVAQMPSFSSGAILSLLEALAPGAELDTFPALQQSFIIERIEVSSDESQICDRYPRRLQLQLNQSDRQEWEIDLVDANDPHVDPPMVST
jgi:hypothetical protein